MLYNANQDRSTDRRQDMEQLRKELKKWEGEGKAKKVNIGDADEYQVCDYPGRSAPARRSHHLQRRHRLDFVELTERARRSRPRSHNPRSELTTEGPEDSEPMSPIEVD